MKKNISTGRPGVVSLLAVLVAGFANLVPAQTTNAYIQTVAGLYWGNATNWNPAGIPNGLDAVVTVSTASVNCSNTLENIAASGAYPYVFGRLNVGGVVIGNNGAGEKLQAQVSSGLPVIDAYGGGNWYNTLCGNQGIYLTNSSQNLGKILEFRYNTASNQLNGTIEIASGATLEMNQDSTFGNATNVIIIDDNGFLSNRSSHSDYGGTGWCFIPATRKILLNAPVNYAGLGTYASGANIYRWTILCSIGELTPGSGIKLAGIAGSGTYGAGPIVFGGANTYTGPTLLKTGTLILSNQNAVAFSTVTLNGGALQFDAGIAANAFNFGGLAATNSGPGYDLALQNNAAAAIALTVGSNNASTTYAGVLNGPGSLVKAGTGTLTLSAANTFSGATAISAGTLALGANASIDASTSLTIGAGATFDVLAINNYALSGATALNASGSAAAATIKGAASGSVDLGTQPITLNFDGANPALTISQGTLSLGGQTITVNTASPLTNGTYNLIRVNSGNLGHAGNFFLAGNAALSGSINFVTNAGVACLQAVIPGNFQTNAVAGNGLRGDFFNSPGFTNLVASQTNGTVNFNWGATPPVAGLGANYSVRWSGQVVPLNSETYTFFVTASTGARLWVNDKQIAARTTTMNGSDTIYGTISLVAGRSYNLMVEYVCNGATNARAMLAWSSPSQPWQVIPSSQLFSTPPATADTGSILDEFWLGLAGTSLTTLTSNTNFPNHPNGRELLTTFESLAPNWTTNLGTHVSGWLVPLTNGYYQFAVAAADTAQFWLSTDATTNNKILLASVPAASGFRQFATFPSQKSAAVWLQGGQKYFIELLQKASTNSAYYSVAWQPPGAAALAVIPGDYLAPSGLHVAQPNQTNLFNTLASGHPRLLTSLERFAWLRQCLAANAPAYVVSTWLNVSNAAAAALTNTSPTGWEVGNDVDIEALGTAYFVTGNTNYAEQAWLEMSNACNLANWNNSSGLTQGSMCKGMGIGYDWFYDYLTPARRSVLTNAMLNLGVAYNQPMYPNYGWYIKTSANNWAMVFNNGSEDLAIALANDAPATSQLLLASAINSMRPIMGHFTTDNGAYFEGQNYWSWGVTHLIYLLAGLQSSLGTEFSLDDTPGFDDTALFEIYNTGPTKLVFDFADAGSWHTADVGLNWLSTRYNRTAAAWWRRTAATYAPSFEDLWWYDGRGTNLTQSGFTPDNYFRGATAATANNYNPIELSTARSVTDNTSASFLGFKAGGMNFNSQGGTHDRIDEGGFVFDALGHRWFWDLGEGNYSDPGYFDGTQRWWIYCCRAEGHNTLVLNPQINTNTDQVITGRSPIIYYSSAPGGDATVNIADLTAAYAFPTQAPSRVWRGTKLFNNRTWLMVQDEIVASTPQNAWWFAHFATSGTTWGISADGSSVTLTNGSNKLWVKLLSGGASFAISNAVPLPTSPNPSQTGILDNWSGYKKLALNYPAATNTTIAVLMVPLAVNASLPANLPAVIPLASWPTNTASLLLPAPPLLAAYTNQAIIAGANLSIASQASDTNQPPQALGFALPVAPAGAGISPTSGIIGWRPAMAQGGTSNLFTVVVTNTASLGATQSFWVGVLSPNRPQLSAPAMAGGQFHFTVQGDPGPDYLIQGTTNLAATNWLTLFTTNQPALPFQWMDTNTAQAQFYYRILLGP